MDGETLQDAHQTGAPIVTGVARQPDPRPADAHVVAQEALQRRPINIRQVWDFDADLAVIGRDRADVGTVRHQLDAQLK